MANMRIKKGDNVVVIAGEEKGAKGEVLVTMPDAGKLIVKEINVVSKHKKPRNQTEPGGIIKQEAAFSASNVMLVCPKCGKATRVEYTFTEVDGKQKKVRVCKKCKAQID